MAIGQRRIKVYEDNGQVRETTVFLPNIKDVISFLQNTWNFNMYDDCFDGKSRLGDVDGSIELYGHTLHIEFKKDRTALTSGQMVKAIRQAKHSNITTLFVFGITNNPTEYLQISPAKLGGSGFIPCDNKSLGKHFELWCAYAKKNNLTKRSDSDWDIAKQIMRSVGGGKK